MSLWARSPGSQLRCRSQALPSGSDSADLGEERDFSFPDPSLRNQGSEKEEQSEQVSWRPRRAWTGGGYARRHVRDSTAEEHLQPSGAHKPCASVATECLHVAGQN